MNSTTILLVDDHDLVRVGFRLLIGRLGDKVTVLEAGDYPEALAIVEARSDIDLVLLDIGLPGAHGLSALLDIKDSPHCPAVAIISGQADEMTVSRAMGAGASAFFSKAMDCEKLLRHLLIVLDGGAYIPTSEEMACTASPSVGMPPAGIAERSRVALKKRYGLTERQLDILDKVICGMPNKSIARALSISGATVRNHLSAVFSSLGVANRLQAAVLVNRLPEQRFAQ